MAEAAVNGPQVAGEESTGTKQKREQSSIDFPYGSLDDAVAVAKAVHKLGGNQCRLGALAAELGHDTVNSGGFRQKLSTAHTFGLTSLSQGVVTLSVLGSRIINPDYERAARADAFLTVPLYKAIYQQFENGLLPPAQGLESAMVNLGVVEKQSAKARQAFQKSAKEAGFFAYGTTKLVYPALGSNAGAAKPKAPEEPPGDAGTNGKNGHGGGDGGNGGGELNPFIKGLLAKLPEPETPWSKEGRKKWLQTAAHIFDLMYQPEGDAAGEIIVTVEGLIRTRPTTSAN